MRRSVLLMIVAGCDVGECLFGSRCRQDEGGYR